MQQSLTQKTLFRSTQYTIEYNGVRLLQRTLTKQVNVFVRFEEIPNTHFTLTVYHKFLLALALVIGLFAGFFAISMINDPQRAERVPGLLFFLVITAVPALLSWLTRKQFIGFSDEGHTFMLRANKPSQAAVATFLDQLRESKTAYLRDMYLNLGSDRSPSEQLRTLLWLKNHEAITQQELEEQKRKLLPETAHPNRLGFAMK